MIENINSALRPLLDICRGQVDQEMLEMFAYAHNHRRFVRGKRVGKAPIEILTGKEIEKTWLDSLITTMRVISLAQNPIPQNPESDKTTTALSAGYQLSTQA